MFNKLFKSSSLKSLSISSKRLLTIDANKQAKIEELIKKSQNMNTMSTTQRFISWLSKNRQQLMNTVMVFFVFQYSFHIYNVQNIYNETIKKLEEKDDEINKIKNVLTDKEWIKNVEDKIIKNKKNGVLLQEVNMKIQSLEPQTPLDLVTKHTTSKEITSNEKKSMI